MQVYLRWGLRLGLVVMLVFTFGCSNSDDNNAGDSGGNNDGKARGNNDGSVGGNSDGKPGNLLDAI